METNKKLEQEIIKKVMKKIQINQKKYDNELMIRLRNWSVEVRKTVNMIIREEATPIIKEILEKEK